MLLFEERKENFRFILHPDYLELKTEVAIK
ncbi:MAG: hypothetical protein ACI8ZX_001483 [Planctomycetota bacterium]|jgi:hypothetical protein